jgi:predicted nucleic acid-binding protein
MIIKKRVYTDTSVIGGCLDVEFEKDSKSLFNSFQTGSIVMVVSDITLAELELAPPAVRDVLNSVPAEHLELVEFSEKAGELAETYLREGIIPQKCRLDDQHIATATENHVDVLVSWNFRHIVNLNRIRGYNSVNLRLGYPLIEIRSPTEVLDYED